MLMMFLKKGLWRSQSNDVIKFQLQFMLQVITITNNEANLTV
jgi:hypothetical protein